jgi:GTP-binding protein
MIDIVQLLFKAGAGGNGWISFRREKFVPKGGPDGGDGGQGGSIILRATRKQATLAHFAGVTEIVAKSGQAGGKKKMYGAAAEDEVIEVPLGTVIWQRASRNIGANRNRSKYYLEKETEPIPARPQFEPPIELPRLDKHVFSKQPSAPDKVLLARLTEEGQEYVIARGGQGGKGNTAFKSSVKTTPLEAEYGAPGEERLIVLELELLADVGLVGLPNAGKSTFLSRVTKAQPKIANYPFTTLSPHLGVWQLARQSSAQEEGSPSVDTVIVADIPGLIEGASQGKGLGHDFLRHVKNCKVLLFVIYLPEAVVFDQSLSTAEKVEQAWEQYQLLDAELRAYSEQLIKKPRVIALNKSDIYPEDLQVLLQQTFTQRLSKTSESAENSTDSISVFLISGATAQGIDELSSTISKLV